MTPFYCALCVHAVWIVLILTVLPESLSSQARAHLAKKATESAEAAKRKEDLEREWEAEDPSDEPNESAFSQRTTATHSRRRKRLSGNFRRLVKRTFHFLEPLTIFVPKERDDGKSGLDWNLTLVAFAIFCTSMNYVSGPVGLCSALIPGTVLGESAIYLLCIRLDHDTGESAH